MALHKKKDFADKCRVTTKDLSNYIKRGKVLLSGDYVDDSIDVNKFFLEKRLRSVKPETLPELTALVPVEPRIEKAVINNPTPNIQEPDESQSHLGNLETIKKKLDIEKTEQEVIKLKAQNDKLHGVVIPTELVKVFFAQHTKFILVEYNNSIDKIITRISKKKSLTNNEVAEIREDVMKEINIAVDKANEESRKNIKSIIEDYSQKKEVGERV